MSEQGIGRVVLAFRIVAFVEALTWVALLIGMFFKYVHDEPTAVRVPGMTHGIVFVLLVVLTFAVAKLRSWDPRTLALGLAGTVLPFCSVVFEVWAQRTGRLSAPAAAESVRMTESAAR